MLMSSALVLLMVPGLALFYGGMVRAKNVLNMFLLVMVSIGVVGIHWVVIGYAMCFAATPVVTIGESNFLGFDPSLVLLRAFDAAHMYRSALSGDSTGAVAGAVLLYDVRLRLLRL